MTSRLYIANSDNTGFIELTGFVPRKGAPFFEKDTSLITLGMRFADGEASQGTFKLLDPEGDLPSTGYNVPPHKVVIWTEDLGISGGDEIWLSRGRVATYDGGREDVVAVDNQVGFDVTVEDGNVDLAGQGFTEEWVRPAETDVARLIALQAYTLNGASSTSDFHRDTTVITISSTHLAPNTDTFPMPAKTYPPGTQPADVVRECADSAGKVYGVVIHHVGVEHLCLLYIAFDDHTTYATAAKISDQIDEWDPTHATAPVLEPHWEMGKASLYDGQELITGIVSQWNDQFIFAQYEPSVESYDYWVESYSDADSVALSQAQGVVNNLIAYRRLIRITHRVSVILEPSQLDLIACGMSIQIKATAALAGEFLGTWQTRRIVECQFEPRSDGRYWAHLHLDRVPRRRPLSRGGTLVPHPPTTGGNLLCGPIDTIASGEGIYLTINAFDCDDATQFDTNAFPVAGQHLGADAGAAITASGWRILQTGVGANAATAVTILGTSDGAKWAAATGQGPGYDFSGAGWSTVASLSGLGSLDNSGSFAASTFRYWVFKATAGGGNSWAGYSLELIGGGSSPTTVGGTGEGSYPDPGEGFIYLPVGSVLEHSNITTGGPYHEAADVTVTPFGTIAATDVQAALVEIVAETTTGAPTTADYLVGTAQGGLSAEIVVGATPGGELGGTWASPTVDATHSGSAHHTENHATRHEDGGADEMAIEDMATAETDDTLRLAPDGAGGVEFATGGGGTGVDVEDEGTPLATTATTLDFVGAGVTASGAGATKTISIPGGSGAVELPIDAAATAAVGSGDLFGGTSLDGGWSQLQSNSITTNRTVDGKLRLERTGAASTQWRGLKRTFSPGGDFTVYARIDWAVMAFDFHGFGIFCGETDPSDAASADRLQLVIYNSVAIVPATNSLGKWETKFATVAAGTETTVFLQDVDENTLMFHPTFPIRLRIRRTSGVYTAGYSVDGSFWREHATTSAFGSTIDTIGLVTLKQTTGNDQDTTFDYIATTG